MLQRLLVTALLFHTCGAFAQAVAVGQPRRIALVIANAKYNFLPAVPAARREGDLMRKSLEAVGFEVTSGIDLTRSQFAALEKSFVSKLQRGDVCWVYYTGYAIQADRVDYLVSTDFQPSAGLGDASLGHALSRLQQRIEETGAGLKVFAIENASETPELAQFSSAQRLRVPEMQNLTQSLIAYATLPENGDAAEGTEIGQFTAALAAAVGEQGVPLFEIFQKVQERVQSASKGRQMPYFVQNITKTWYLREPVKQDVVRAGVYYPNPRDRQDYVWIPAGSFLMGCVPSSEKGAKCEPEEGPRHKVTLTKNFWIGRTEVETSAYKRFVNANQPRRMPKESPFWNKKWKEEKDFLPMAFVDWESSRDYCAWAGGRLPTEAEWEYAARAGSEDRVFPHQGSDSREKANFQGKQGNDRFEDPAPVKKFDANGFGLYDMAGNLWEWVNDWYSPQYYAESPEVDPQGPSAGKQHSIRGGSFASNPLEHLRISFRRGSSEATEVTGFRCVLPDTPATRSVLGVK